MITKEFIKLKLNISDTSRDVEIDTTIEMMKEFIITYTNNNAIDFTSSALDIPLLFLCLRELNYDTSLRAGKDSENLGSSFSFSSDLPIEIKRVLNAFTIRKIGFKG